MRIPYPVLSNYFEWGKCSDNIMGDVCERGRESSLLYKRNSGLCESCWFERRLREGGEKCKYEFSFCTVEFKKKK